METKLDFIGQLNNVTLSRFQSIATSVITYGLYVQNMFTMQNFAYKIWKQLINVMNYRPPT